MGANGLETALECVARGWPVVPGALWVGDSYVDPVTDADCDALALSSPAMATLDPEEVRRLWPVSGGNVTRSALAVLGTLMTAVVVEPEPARRVVASKAFRTSPTPVVMLPVPTLGLLIESAVFVVSSAEGLDERLVFPRGAMLPLPPAVVEGHRTRWLVSPAECDGLLMSGPDLADLLALETSNRR
ncbi:MULTISPECIES: hypothetical protein [Saccharothrix]|uniref:hypothetical protein n=1 Tax=Saccharothrix TaxID=2071 RepID=UPI000A65415F|nr:hypothetical protein [Saccharothrix sp. CB00851]